MTIRLTGSSCYLFCSEIEPNSLSDCINVLYEKMANFQHQQLIKNGLMFLVLELMFEKNMFLQILSMRCKSLVLIILNC